MAGLLRHRQTKGAATDRLGLRDAESCFLLYPDFLTPDFLRRRLHKERRGGQIDQLPQGGSPIGANL